jgi:hypothetical protein
LEAGARLGFAGARLGFAGAGFGLAGGFFVGRGFVAERLRCFFFAMLPLELL